MATPPKYISDAATLGLEYYRAGKGGAGLTDQTLADARLMAKGTITDGQVPVPPAMQRVASQPECRDAIRREDENWQVQAPMPSAR